MFKVQEYTKHQQKGTTQIPKSELFANSSQFLNLPFLGSPQNQKPSSEMITKTG